jgi:hypothetical protein
MRSVISLILLPAVLAQGCATTAASNPTSAPATSASAGQPRPTDPGKLQEITDDLAGEPATVALTSGEVVQKAQSIRLGTEVTSWHDASGRERTVPTAEVRRVLREQRHLIGRGFGYGATAGVLPGYLVFQGGGCRHGRGCSEFYGSEGAFIAGVLVVIAGGLIGMAVAAANRHPVVVYTGPAPPHAAATPDPSTIQHCRLASAAASDVLDCGQLAR